MESPAPVKQVPSNNRSLYILGANVSLQSETFNTVIQYLGMCNFAAASFFEHIRFLELFRGQLVDFYPDEVSELGDEIANGMVVIWEVDRVMPQTLWDRLVAYVNRYSKSTPVPIILFANLSAEIMLSSTDYQLRLVRDIQFFLTNSFDPTPSKWLWKALLLRDNQLQPDYFKAHMEWLFSHAKRKPQIIMPPNWQELKLRPPRLVRISSQELIKGPKISEFSSQANYDKRFFNSDDSETAQWFRSLAERTNLEKTHSKVIEPSDLTVDPLSIDSSVGQKAKLLQEISASIIKAESVIGRQEWIPGEVDQGMIKELVCWPKTPGGKAYRHVVLLPQLISRKDMSIMMQELFAHHHTVQVESKE